MNPAAERVTGYTLDEIKERPLHDSVHYLYPDGRPFPMSECPIDRNSAALVAMQSAEDIFTTKNGTLFPVVCNVAPISKDGKTVVSIPSLPFFFFNIFSHLFLWVKKKQQLIGTI